MSQSVVQSSVARAASLVGSGETDSLADDGDGRRFGRSRTISVEGQIDPGTVLALQRRIVDALGDGHREIVVDLRSATVRGAGTAQMLGGALRRVTHRGAMLAVLAGAAVASMLELSGVDEVVVYPAGDGAGIAAAIPGLVIV